MTGVRATTLTGVLVDTVLGLASGLVTLAVRVWAPRAVAVGREGERLALAGCQRSQRKGLRTADVQAGSARHRQRGIVGGEWVALVLVTVTEAVSLAPSPSEG